MNKIYTYLRKQYINLRNLYLLTRRWPYIKQIKRYISNDTTIISSNCFAGRIMQDLRMQYNSPTLGLWMMPDDFPVFCNNLKYFLQSEVTITKHSKNELGEYKRTHWKKHPYPVGALDGKLEIHFLHYHTQEEAINKWKRRANRINLKKVLIIGSEQNGCTEEDIKKFDSIPYEGKLFFCSKPYPYKCIVYIPEFANQGHVGDPYKQGHIFYKYLANWLKANHDKIGEYR